MLYSLLNGHHQTSIDCDHRLLAYGDGVFTSCRAKSGVLQFWPDHLERLETGLQRLAMRWTPADRALLHTELQTLLALYNEDVVYKIILGRHSVGRGYIFDPATQRTDRLIQIFPFKAQSWHQQGAWLVTADCYASQNLSLAGLKHLNRLDSVLARQAAVSQNADEAILTTADGRLVEGSMSNLYLKIAHHWYTPEIVDAGVSGIVRQRLLQHELGIDCRTLQHQDLAKADAMMISNSLIGLVPVKGVLNQTLHVDPHEVDFFRKAIGLSDD